MNNPKPLEIETFKKLRKGDEVQEIKTGEICKVKEVVALFVLLDNGHKVHIQSMFCPISMERLFYAVLNTSNYKYRFHKRAERPKKHKTAQPNLLTIDLDKE